MLAIIIAMIVMILFAGIALNGHHTSINTIQMANKAEDFKNEIKMVKNSLLALSTTFNETIEDDQIVKYAALPIGTASGATNLLPAQMKKKNVFNKEILYCPFGAKLSNTFTAVVNGGPTVTYDVETKPLTKNNRTLDYVIGTADNNFSNIGILGVIISPNNLLQTPLNCNGLVYSNETQSFTIEGGRVETITALEIEAVNL